MVFITKRDSRAFEELYDRYSRRMVNYFYKMLWQDEEKAQDFMQDLFSKIVHKPHLFDESRVFKTWIYSVANNMCKNEYRKREVRKISNNSIEGDVAGEKASKTINKIDLGAFSEKLEVILHQLDDKKSGTFRLRFYEDMSIKEISEIMDCSEGTVKSRIFYTLKLLNKELSEYREILQNG